MSPTTSTLSVSSSVSPRLTPRSRAATKPLGAAATPEDAFSTFSLCGAGATLPPATTEAEVLMGRCVEQPVQQPAGGVDGCADAFDSYAEASSPAAHIGRYEFLVYTLLLLGKVEASDVLDINDLFRALDKESLGDLESDVMPALRSVSSAILLEQESQDLSTPPPQSADAEDPWAIGMIV